MQKAFITEIEAMLGENLPAFLRAMNEPAALALRINPLRGQPAQSAAQPYIEDKVPWAAHGYYLNPTTRPGASIAHSLGAFYMQEASAMVSAAVMNAQPGEKILDLCAAPGGKTTQLAASMLGQGLLISNEPIPSRAKILAENLERLGVPNAVAVNAYPDQLCEKWRELFDGVLVDAPCSGEGMFRRDPDSRSEWNPASPAGCAKRQKDILDEAAKMVRPGGRLVYSTCTFNRTENEGSIESFLERHKDFEIEEFSLPGIGNSQNGMLRVWPHLVRGDGHFVAKLRKISTDSDISLDPPRKIRKQKSISKAEARKNAQKPRTVSEESPEMLVARLEKDICKIPETLKNGTPVRFGDYVHLLPEGTPALDGIKTAKPGLCLMRVGRSHVQPMPALALACGENDWNARPARKLDVDEETIGRILRGERPELSGIAGEKGWTLIGWNGLPAAFIKIS